MIGQDTDVAAQLAVIRERLDHLAGGIQILGDGMNLLLRWATGDECQEHAADGTAGGDPGAGGDG